ncbi:MAG TPA: serine hydrolase domain-containing protein, partial [Nannocystaceae bacterium]|nr:serine hydrolase domain-containing protein [Nannocystaceae bacterium]
MLATLAACAREPDTERCPTAIALAERAYLDCTDGLGLTVESLAIDASGGIDVVFGDDATADQIDRALHECEPALAQALALGQLACTSTDVGHPASEAAIAAAVEDADGFVGAVVVVRDGQPLWRGGKGLADRDAELPNTPDVAFDCGSIMKVMTAAAIYQLEAEGALTRDTTLGALFDAVPSDKADV